MSLNSGNKLQSMVGATRHHGGASRPDGSNNPGDFALGWIGTQVGIAERRLVTVLCCAIVVPAAEYVDNSGGSDQSLAAKQSVRAVIASHGGHLLQSAGGTLIAVWGYPRAHADVTRRALAAATASRRVLPAGIGVRITLDAGLVMIRQPAAPADDQADLTGAAIDAVQVMQAQCPIGRVLASATVRRLARTDSAFRAIDPAALPATALFEVEGLDAEADAPTAQRIVGHDLARRLVDDCIDTTARGTACGGVLIEGEAGIGKSAIVAEAHEVRASGARATWIEIVCLHETRSVPLAPVQRALQRLLCRTAPHDEQPQIATALRERLGAAGSEALESFLAVAGARVAAATTTLGETRLRPLDLVADALLALASDAPLVIVVEDLQWADSATRALVERLSDQLATAHGMALLVTSREDLSGLLKPGRPLRRIVLQRLDHEQIARILAARPEAVALPPATHEAIARRSEGVPLYAVEIARYHLQGGEMPAGDGLASPFAGLDGASNLQLLFAARLDQLGELKPLVQAASILGRRFETAALAQLVGAAASRLSPSLAALADCGVIEHDTSPSFAACRFTHSLLRDAAYATIPRGMRVSMHQRAAQILAEGFAPGGPIAAELIAAHHELAGDHAGAFLWWRSAADAAIAISETSGAVAHLGAALAAADRAEPPVDVARRLETMRLLALQLCIVHGNASSEGIVAYRNCLDLAEKHPQEAAAVEFDVLWGLQSCHLVRGDIRDALAIGERLVNRVGDAVPPTERLLATRIHALTLLLAGQLEPAAAGYSEVIDTYRIERDARLRFEYGSDQRALAFTHRAWANAIMNREADAHADRSAALKAVRKLNHPHTTAHVTCVLASIAETAGEHEIAAAMAASGRMVADQHRFPYWSAWADLVLGAVEGAASPQRGRTMIAKAIGDYRETGARQALPYAYLLLARASRRCGRSGEAIDALREALVIVESSGLGLYRAEIHRELAETRLATGGCDERLLLDAEGELALASQWAAQQGAVLFANRIAATTERLHARRRVRSGAA